MQILFSVILLGQFAVDGSAMVLSKPYLRTFSQRPRTTLNSAANDGFDQLRRSARLRPLAAKGFGAGDSAPKKKKKNAKASVSAPGSASSADAPSIVAASASRGATAAVARPDPEVIARASAEVSALFSNAADADGVRRAMQLAWEAGWDEQESEIADLTLQAASERDTGDGGIEIAPTPAASLNATRLDVRTLWRMSENASATTTTTTTTTTRDAQRARGRALTAELFSFWRTATSSMTEAKMAERLFYYERATGARAWSANVPNVSSAATARAVRRERLRLLNRHRSAGAVEYRIFGEVRSSVRCEDRPSLTTQDNCRVPDRVV